MINKTVRPIIAFAIVWFVFYLIGGVVISYEHLSFSGFNIVEWTPDERGAHMEVTILIGGMASFLVWCHYKINEEKGE